MRTEPPTGQATQQATQQPTAPPRAGRRSGPWWRDAVCYEIYVRSFADGNGDGVGDLPGIRSRLPYLRDLGVDAIWITPFYRSPMADGGYDVADYRDVDPLFGTLADFDALLADAHGLGLRVVVDIVPNHTSSEHPWFREALAAPRGSPARARYIFRDSAASAESADGPPNDWESVFGGRAWTRTPDGQWYLHLFTPEQPDLDWRNPDVGDDFERTLHFWLDRGVDGFRVDVAHGLVKDATFPDAAGTLHPSLASEDDVVSPMWDQPEVHEVYRRWRKVLDSYPGERMAVAEAWIFAPDALARYVRPDELHQAFNFRFLKAPWRAPDWREVVEASLDGTTKVGATTTWVLSNHDVERHVTRYGGGEQGVRRARAALLFLLALPGSVYLYQGEELSLPEVTDLPADALQDPIWERSGRTQRGRDGCRVPLPWEQSGSSLGFGPNGAQPWLPQPGTWGALSVAAQIADRSSMLQLYREALSLRRREPALGDGTLRWVDPPAEDVLAFARNGDALVCVLNMGAAPARIPAYGDRVLASAPVEGELLAPDTAAWFRASP